MSNNTRNTGVREKILNVATELFYKYGIHATGINTIIADANIARMSLYNHFPSKEALIEAILRRHFEQTQQQLQQVVAQPGELAHDKLRRLFNGLQEITESPDFFGCPFINTVAEYGDSAHTFHRLAAEYKQMYRDSIAQIVSSLAVADPTTLAAQLFLLVEGTLVMAQVDGATNPAKQAFAVAEILLDFYQKNSRFPCAMWQKRIQQGNEIDRPVYQKRAYGTNRIV